MIITLQTYKKQLHILIADCPIPNANLEKLNYNREDLLEMVKNYNSYHKQTSFIQTKERGNTYFSVLAGLTQPRASMNSLYQSFSFFETQRMDSSKISPCIGVSLEHNYARLRGKLAIGGEFKGSFVTLNYTEIVKASFEHRYQFSMKSLLLSTNGYMRYYFSTGKIKPYVKAGIGLTYYTAPEVTFVYTSLTTAIPQKTTLKKTKLNYLGSVGAKWDAFFLEARLESWYNGTDYDWVFMRYPSLIVGYSWNWSVKK